MGKWIYGRIGKYATDMALDFTAKRGECHSKMEEFVKRELKESTINCLGEFAVSVIRAETEKSAN